jgi:hypothetical protein
LRCLQWFWYVSEYSWSSWPTDEYDGDIELNHLVCISCATVILQVFEDLFLFVMVASPVTCLDACLRIIIIILIVDICVQNMTIDVFYGCCGMMLLLILLMMKKWNNERITNHAHDAASAGAVMMVEMKIVMMI